MFTFVGIDPGKSGAIAVVEDNFVVEIQNFDLLTYKMVLQKYVLTKDKDTYAIFIEDVHAMPNQGVTSTFHFGENFGQICGLIMGLGLKYEKVTPQMWKKELRVTHNKQTSINRALELYPSAPLLRTKLSRTPDNNRAEALLISHYARLHFKV